MTITILALAINIIFIALFFLYLISAKIIAISIGVSLIAWFFFFLWKRQNLVEQRIKGKVFGQAIVQPLERVMFRAQESYGYSQTSGTAYMVLTEQALYFELVLLDRSLMIPRSKITDVDKVYRLLGVSPGRLMLKISFTDEKGQADAIAVTMPDMDVWAGALLQSS